MVSADVPRAARRAENSDWVDHAVRGGLVAYGVVHLLVGWLAAQLALGDSAGSASSDGALHELARKPFGGVLVWLVAVGMLLLVLWRLLEATAGHRDCDGGERWRKRATSVLKAGIYGAVGLSAVGVAAGSGGGGGGGRDGSETLTSRLMTLPAGDWIVAAVGVAVVGYGGNLVRRAWTEKFREHLTAEGRSGQAGAAYLWTGKIGYAGKGIAVGVVGALFCWAAWTHDPEKSGGLDQALQQVRQQPFGQALLLVIAVGIVCYGLFTFARARHLSR